MPAHFNSSCCLSRKEIKPQVVFLCSKWPPGDGLKLIPCVACCASESRGYWVFSYFVPSKLCLENQGLLGSTQSLWTKYPQLIQTRGNWTVIGLDLTLFFFCSSADGVLSSCLQARGYLKWVIYLFMHFYYHKNQIATFKKKTCLWRVVAGGANKLKSEKGGYIFIKRQHQINFSLVSGTHVKFIGCLLILL